MELLNRIIQRVGRSELERAYQRGYDVGHDEGYTSGYDQGEKGGYARGKEEGVREERSAAYQRVRDAPSGTTSRLTLADIAAGNF